MSYSFNFTVLSGFQPNYAIKRDLRENTGFKFYIGRVGPLFWLLAGESIFFGLPVLYARVSFPALPHIKA